MKIILTIGALVVIFGIAWWTGRPSITWEPPIPVGKLKFDFSEEKKHAVSSTAALSKLVNKSLGELVEFPDYQFGIGKPPLGCKPFETAKFKDFAMGEKGFKAIEASIKQTEKGYGWIPDDMALSFALYQASALRSSCGPEIIAQLQSGSRINGWLVTDKALPNFRRVEQSEVRMEPNILVIALNKAKLQGRLKPTASNLLMSRYRFEIPPNYDTLTGDPTEGIAVLTYSLKLENVRVANKIRDVLAGGIVRYYTGAEYLYIVDFFAFKPETTDEQWQRYTKYMDTFHYVK
jgi:hypothetical protein